MTIEHLHFLRPIPGDDTAHSIIRALHGSRLPPGRHEFAPQDDEKSFSVTVLPNGEGTIIVHTQESDNLTYELGEHKFKAYWRVNQEENRLLVTDIFRYKKDHVLFIKSKRKKHAKRR